MIVPDNSLLQSTFQIIYGGNTGTCFQYIHQNGNMANIFLITVRHLFPNDVNGAGIHFSIATENGRAPIAGRIYFPDNPAIDISVIKINEPLCPFYAFSFDNYSIGQDAFFCGFPLGLRMASLNLNNGYPLPIVKKAMLSSFDHRLNQFLFDGHNNRGFSGSPIGYHETISGRTFIIGIVCAYYSQTNNLTIQGADYHYTENSGIFIANSFSHVYGIIDTLRTDGLLDGPELI